MIPHQGCNAIAASKSGKFEGTSQTTRSPIHGAVVRAHDRMVRPPGYDFDLSVELSCALEDRHEGQGKVHHGSEHGNLRRAWAHRTTNCGGSLWACFSWIGCETGRYGRLAFADRLRLRRLLTAGGSCRKMLVRSCERPAGPLRSCIWPEREVFVSQARSGVPRWQGPGERT